MVRRIQPRCNSGLTGSISAVEFLKKKFSTDVTVPSPFTRRQFCSVSPLILNLPEEESDPHRLLSILSISPSLKSMVPAISPSHVSSLFSLDLDPKTAPNFFSLDLTESEIQSQCTHPFLLFSSTMDMWVLCLRSGYG
ncbi:unnamed protein product [Arabidopsis lyrata]|uniref:Uncharacterized protein n=1 Tax=Arabidopsis lyrata subsp. lyrata TaxID=81972 RepID=D7MUL1_ARALL|nr:hypothetical protein ARALYDRAFT_919912 [Arabidopsis lyrata subsp. lyrata]CAH8280934.1 unnamed protein product [Arabidopsis lyrata]